MHKACNSLSLLTKKTKRKNTAPLFASAEVSKYYHNLINFWESLRITARQYYLSTVVTSTLSCFPEPRSINFNYHLSLL